MFLLPSPLSVLKLPIIRECECECECECDGRGKKGTPPPRVRRESWDERGERGKVSSFPFPLPRALLHLFLAVAPTFEQYYEKSQLKTLATQVTRKVTVAKFENFPKTEASL